MMLNSPRFLLILLIALLTVSAGCSVGPCPEDVSLAEKERHEQVTPKAYIDDRPSGADAYYGGYYERGVGKKFNPSGWTDEELRAATFIHGSNIYFHFDSSALTSDAKAVLKQKAERIKAFPQLHVIIGGHSDERGTDEYNLRLGQRRAKSAYDYLISLGVPARQLGTQSFGKRFPIATGNDEESYSQNRRDEFLVSKP